MTLVEFLTARLDEDEARVDTAPAFMEDAESVRGPGWGNRGDCPICGAYQFDGLESVTEDAWWEHVEVYHQRARVLREVEAKRATVASWTIVNDDYRTSHSEFTEGRRFGLTEAVAHLAAVYSDHPDYDEAWRP